MSKNGGVLEPECSRFILHIEEATLLIESLRMRDAKLNNNEQCRLQEYQNHLNTIKYRILQQQNEKEIIDSTYELSI